MTLVDNSLHTHVLGCHNWILNDKLKSNKTNLKFGDTP